MATSWAGIGATPVPQVTFLNAAGLVTRRAALGAPGRFLAGDERSNALLATSPGLGQRMVRIRNGKISRPVGYRTPQVLPLQLTAFDTTFDGRGNAVLHDRSRLSQIWLTRRAKPCKPLKVAARGSRIVSVARSGRNRVMALWVKRRHIGYSIWVPTRSRTRTCPAL